MTEAVERLIALQGAVNFRDLGGYAAGEGMRTRWRVLFRADGLGELTEPDLAVLRALGIRTVIDLRSGSELERGRFDVDAHPVAFHHFPFIEELPDAEEFDRRPGLLGSQYQEMLRDAGGQILAALEVLAAPDALPAVFHCTAGKDRTGVLSAIVLSLLGVDEPTVVADYALSGEAMERLRAKLIVKYPDSRDVIENIDEVFSAEPAQMELLLDHLRERYGSVDTYVAGLGAGPGVVEGLRAGLLEPASRPSSRLADVGAQAVDGAGERQVEQRDPARVVRGQRQAHRVPADVDVGVVVGRLGRRADGVDELEGGGEVVQLDRGDEDVALPGPVQALLVERGVDVGLREHRLAHGCVMSSGRTAASNCSAVR